MPNELERWRERQLDVYQRAQVIDQLERIALLDEYRHCQVIGQMDEQNVGLSQLAVILADTSEHVAWMEADIARLLAVTDRHLSTVVDHLALVGERLADIAATLAAPRETEAWEFFGTGTRALVASAKMSGKGAQSLAEEWLDKAIGDLNRATEIYAERPQFWYHLGLALGRRGHRRDAARAFRGCAGYALADDCPEFAAQAVLLAADHLQSAGDQGGARDLLHAFLPVLDTCAEIYLSLAIHHDETGLLAPALTLAPLLVVAIRAEIDDLKATAADEATPAPAKQAAAAAAATLARAGDAAAAKVCQDEDSPVGRLRRVEAAVQALIDLKIELALDISAEGFTATSLPAGSGIDALLLAQRRIHEIARQAETIADSVRAGLGTLQTEARARLQQIAEAKALCQEAITAERARGAQDTAPARRAVTVAEQDSFRARIRVRIAQKAKQVCGTIYENGELREDFRIKMLVFAGRRQFPVSLGSKLNELLRLAKWGQYHDHPFPDDAHFLVAWHYSEAVGRNPQASIYEVWQMIEPEGINRSSLDYSFEKSALLILEGLHDVLPAEFEHAEQAAYDADIRLRKAREELDAVSAVADRKVQEITKQAEHAVRIADAEYVATRDNTTRAANRIAGLLADLDTAVAAATSPRERLIPNTSMVGHRGR